MLPCTILVCKMFFELIKGFGWGMLKEEYCFPTKLTIFFELTYLILYLLLSIYLSTNDFCVVMTDCIFEYCRRFSTGASSDQNVERLSKNQV